MDSQCLEHPHQVDVQLCVQPQNATNDPGSLVWVISWRVGPSTSLRILRREPRSGLNKLWNSIRRDAPAGIQDADQVLVGTNLAIIDMECYTLGALGRAQRMKLLQVATAAGRRGHQTDRQWVEHVLEEAVGYGLLERSSVQRCINEALA